MDADPGHARWMARQAVVGDESLVVGHAGFHGPPDEAGMVEIGYSIDPRFRRRGYARSTLIELLRRAAAEPTVATVRATIGPDNVASLATISGFGFTHVGEEWDEEDGHELVFEARHAGGVPHRIPGVRLINACSQANLRSYGLRTTARGPAPRATQPGGDLS
ncbi:GNAT family N-acetyltransferase [Streptomyces sp. NPDC056296]|uniref:GNAT family N-acetyltransferase n=1 Tax=Streptomyces sp. NPDC056296 TaxID=3345775 RepID=UPI0035E0909C